MILAYLAINPGAVLLLDEPDAHLEILRQRQIYRTLTEVGRQTESQVVIATHSEVILNEASGRDAVVAFLGRPHAMRDQSAQVLKSLREIGYDQYYQAELRGWVLYLEGSTDLDMLSAFAGRLGHDAGKYLEAPFVHYVADQPTAARHHFFGIREAKEDLVGVAIFDRIDARLDSAGPLRECAWRKREFENYICNGRALRAWARDACRRQFGGGNLFQPLEDEWEHAMDEAVNQVESALRTLGTDAWGPEVKAGDEVLRPVFDIFLGIVGAPMIMPKRNYYEVARFMPLEDIDPEITDVLDSLVEVATGANGTPPAGEHDAPP